MEEFGFQCRVGIWLTFSQKKVHVSYRETLQASFGCSSEIHEATNEVSNSGIATQEKFGSILDKIAGKVRRLEWMDVSFSISKVVVYSSPSFLRVGTQPTERDFLYCGALNLTQCSSHPVTNHVSSPAFAPLKLLVSYPARQVVLFSQFWLFPAII